MDKREFRDIVGSFVTGVTVVTTMIKKDHQPVGTTVNSFSSLSLEPLLVLFSIDKNAGLHDTFFSADTFVVNILSAKQEEVSRKFAMKNVDRFSGVHYELGRMNAPILKESLAYIDCQMYNMYDGGDHTIFIGEVIDGHVNKEKEPLVFFQGKYYHSLKLFS